MWKRSRTSKAGRKLAAFGATSETPREMSSRSASVSGRHGRQNDEAPSHVRAKALRLVGRASGREPWLLSALLSPLHELPCEQPSPHHGPRDVHRWPRGGEGRSAAQAPAGS